MSAASDVNAVERRPPGRRTATTWHGSRACSSRPDRRSCFTRRRHGQGSQLRLRMERHRRRRRDRRGGAATRAGRAQHGRQPRAGTRDGAAGLTPGAAQRTVEAAGTPSGTFTVEGPVLAEILVVALNGTDIRLSGPCGAEPWLVEVADGDPTEVVTAM